MEIGKFQRQVEKQEIGVKIKDLMRIVTVVNSIPPVSGGAQRVAWDLSLKLNEFGHECHILTFSDKAETSVREGLVIHKIKKPLHTHSNFLLGKGQKQAYAIVNSINPDIIHSHGFSILVYSLRNFPASKILTLHNSKFEDYNFSLFEKVKNKFLAVGIASSYDVISTPSKNLIKYFQNYFNREILCVPNGVNLSNFKFKSLARKKNQYYL